MKKRLWSLGIFLLLCMTGCGEAAESGALPSTQQSAEMSALGYLPPVIEGEETELSDNEETTRQEEIREELGLTEENLSMVMAEQEGNYAYETMDESYQLLYAEILTILNHHGENVKISTNNSDDLQYVFQCVYNDHPEIYWIDGYSYVRHTQNDEIVYLTFTGKYIYTEEEVRLNQVSIDQYVASCFAGISSSASEYEKVKYVYEYIIENTEYNMEARDNQNILSVFLYGESVCQGYAKAMQYLLNKLDVECTMVVGSVISGEGHAWNLVNIDGAYYYVDATWGDASYIIEGTFSDETRMPVNYDYLNITTQHLQQTHQIENVVPMPYCIETVNNYYVKEDRYITYYDTATLTDVFNRAYEREEECLTLKCADAAIYDTLCEQLIANQQIFMYLHSETTSVIYSTSDEQYTLSFWL